MKTLIASLVAAAAMATGAMLAPAIAQDANETVMVNSKGETVDSLLLRYTFDGTWVIDTKRILLRDAHREHYLLTLTKECTALNLDREFVLFPALEGRVRSSLRYEVRNRSGPYCEIGKIEQIGEETAQALRKELVAKG